MWCGVVECDVVWCGVLRYFDAVFFCGIFLWYFVVVAYANN